MTILDKEVWISLGQNARYYEHLGYNIPKHIDSHGIERIKMGTKLLVKIEDLSTGSRTSVRYVCDYCNGKNQIDEKSKYRSYFSIMAARKKSRTNKDCCGNEICMKKKMWETKNSQPIPKGESLAEKYPHLINEWSDKNQKTPFQYTHGSEEIVWWKCPNCDSEYNMKIVTRGYHKCNCPYCRGRRVNHTNCLWTTHPQIAKLLKNPQRGYEINAGRNKKEEFICLDCNYSDFKIVQSVVKHGFSCPKCSDNISYPEKFVFNVLLQLNVKVKRQKLFNWSKKITNNNPLLCGNKKYDFYLPELNCIIETHGEQHYYDKNRHFKKNVKDEKENDKLKEKIAIENHIANYIVIDCSISNPDFIKNNLINSKLSTMLNLESVNWKECHSYAVTSLVKPTCELWMKLKNIKEVANEIHLDVATVRRYLVQGSKLGFCDYNPQQEAEKIRQENLIKARQTRLIKVVQLTEEGDFIREWQSATQAQNELNVNNIPTVCRGRQDTAGGFKWMYKTDYDKLLNVKGEIKFSTKQRIVKLTLDGEFIEEYKKIGDAAKSVGVKSSNISSIKTSCDNNRRTAYGFRWMYKDDYMKLKEIIK